MFGSVVKVTGFVVLVCVEEGEEVVLSSDSVDIGADIGADDCFNAGLSDARDGIYVPYKPKEDFNVEASGI
jgi:hypothetical protein